MTEVGIKQLKNELSAVLRRVARGEHIRVTSRGRAIADILPAGRGAGDVRWRRLVADGRLTPARVPLPRRAPRPQRGTRSASAEVLAEREDGR